MGVTQIGGFPVIAGSEPSHRIASRGSLRRDVPPRWRRAALRARARASAWRVAASARAGWMHLRHRLAPGAINVLHAGMPRNPKQAVRIAGIRRLPALGVGLPCTVEPARIDGQPSRKPITARRMTHQRPARQHAEHRALRTYVDLPACWMFSMRHGHQPSQRQKSEG